MPPHLPLQHSFSTCWWPCLLRLLGHYQASHSSKQADAGGGDPVLVRHPCAQGQRRPGGSRPRSLASPAKTSSPAPLHALRISGLTWPLLPKATSSSWSTLGTGRPGGCTGARHGHCHQALVGQDWAGVGRGEEALGCTNGCCLQVRGGTVASGGPGQVHSHEAPPGLEALEGPVPAGPVPDGSEDRCSAPAPSRALAAGPGRA